MELKTMGKDASPAVLLLPGEGIEPEAVLAALKTMGRRYRLLLPVFDPGEGPEALEDALLRECAGRLWGAYGLGSGADMLLRLIARGKVRVRSWVTEGPVALPEEPLPERPGRGWSWIRAKDKAGERSLAALREACGGVASMTMKKLPKKKSTLSYCPKFAVGRMEKSFGSAVSVSRSARISAPAASLWSELNEGPIQKEIARLREMLPVEKDEARHVLILEGKGERTELWSHLIRLESDEDGVTICTDQILMQPRGKAAPAVWSVKLYLAYIQLCRSLSARKKKA